MAVIRRVAVLGAGTMGARIAAHFANAGVPALLLDIVRSGAAERNLAAIQGLEAAASQRPPAFFTSAARKLVTPGNFEDHLGEVQRVDWVIEAVTEDLAIKRALFEKVALWRRPETILSTNTSGIPLRDIAEGFSSEFRRRFLGTHFFNPPRYLHLLELIPGPETDPEVLCFIAAFAERRLGKGVVPCKDTPNFIANRLGAFFGCTAHHLMEAGGYSVEEVDALTGPLIGLPRSASMRLVDVIGLDVWARVVDNVYQHAPADPCRDRFTVPGFLRDMMARGWLGEKSGQGFYRRAGQGPTREIQALDWRVLEYRPQQRPELDGVAAVRAIAELPQRLRALVALPGRAGGFLWRLLSDYLLYAADRVPEISERTVEIDRAMRWGYAHALGPFELWDALGVKDTAARVRREGRELPASVDRMLASGAESFYHTADKAGRPGTRYFDLAGARWTRLEDRAGVLDLPALKRARGVLQASAGASLLDLGGGVLCLELHGHGALIGDEQIAVIPHALEQAARGFAALVIASSEESFCAGWDLAAVLDAARHGRWAALDAALRRRQEVCAGIRSSALPVVAAPFHLALGPGCELAMHAARVQAQAELALGLADADAGLIPSCGSSLTLRLRLGDSGQAMALLGAARVSACAAEARAMGLLRACDRISMNPERLLGDACRLARQLARRWRPEPIREAIEVGGEAEYLRLIDAGPADSRPAEVREKLAFVLSGGRGAPRRLSEQALLDLEREAYLSLCGQPATQQRIERLLAGTRS